ncbi:hypothetical protein GVAV_001743 [Gurleya vavrai]
MYIQFFLKLIKISAAKDYTNPEAWETGETRNSVLSDINKIQSEDILDDVAMSLFNENALEDELAENNM